MYSTHLADVFQIHGVYNHLIIIWDKLFVDRVVKWPWLWQKQSFIVLHNWLTQSEKGDDSHQELPSFSVSQCCPGWRRRPPDRHHPAGGWWPSPASPACPPSAHAKAKTVNWAGEFFIKPKSRKHWPPSVYYHTSPTWTEPLVLLDVWHLFQQKKIHAKTSRWHENWVWLK